MYNSDSRSNSSRSMSFRSLPEKDLLKFDPNAPSSDTSDDKSTATAKESRPTSLYVILYVANFIREATAVLMYYWMKHHLGSDIFYVKALTLFGVNILMKLPYMNPLVFIISLVTNKKMRRTNINSVVYEDTDVAAVSGMGLFLFYLAAEVFGVTLSAMATISSDFYFGTVIVQNSITPTSGINGISAFGRPRDVNWQVCPTRDWHIDKLMEKNSDVLRPIETARKECFNKSGLSLDSCYTYSYLGKEDGFTQESLYNCMFDPALGGVANAGDFKTNFYAYWLLNETVAMAVYLIMALHVWCLLYDDNKQRDEKTVYRLDSSTNMMTPISSSEYAQVPRSRQSKYLKSIWNTALYMSVVTFVMQMAFPFARFNPIDCLYTILSVQFRGIVAGNLVAEMGWRIFGEILGFFVFLCYYYIAFMYDYSPIAYTIAWGELPPTKMDREVFKND